MKNIEILQKVADLVGFKFSNVSYKFAEVELEGGVVITNSTEGDFMLGDLISIKNEDGTFTMVGAGEHMLADGRKFITDEEGKLVEVIEAGVEETEEGVEITIEGGNKEMMESVKIEELKQAIHDVLFAFETQAKEIVELRKDYETFKKSASHSPLKEDKVVSSNFSDHRYEILKQMKQNRK